MLADYHVHSEFSDDSWYPVDDICQDAIRRNLDEICFTDHVDYGIKPDVEEFRLLGPSCTRTETSPAGVDEPVLNVDYERYFPKLEEARERWAPLGTGRELGGLSVKIGLELGVQSHETERNRALVERYRDRMDFAILSIHQVGDEEFWTGDFQRERTQEEYNLAYYEEMLRVVERFSDYAVLGHMDLIKRYDPAGIFPFERTRDIVAAILERVIADGKGIEVNTSSFRYGLPDLQPCTEILELYRDLGGRVITVGSDSHKSEHLGAYIGMVRKRLAALGYTEWCTFDRWEPVFHAL